MANTKNNDQEEQRSELQSFKFRPTLLHKLRYMAVMDKPSQIDILEIALNDYIAKWEKKHGEIPQRKA